jgi:hypothetical protein
MMNVKRCQAFLMAKGRLSALRCSDSISIDESHNRFAIADGVTQSFFPQYFSRALTEGFIERTDPASQFFQGAEIANTFNNVLAFWHSQANEYQQNANNLEKTLIEERRHDNPLGASTFAGVTIEGDEIDVVCIGDSCVFIVPDDKKKSPSMVTSMPFTLNDESCKLFFDCEFGSNPHIINTDGILSTMPITERIVPGTCWLLMMTDALSEWFVKHFDRNDESEALNCLISLSTQDDFEEFVRSKRLSAEMDDDDTSLLIVRIESTDKELDAQCENQELSEDEVNKLNGTQENLICDSNECPKVESMGKPKLLRLKKRINRLKKRIRVVVIRMFNR